MTEPIKCNKCGMNYYDKICRGCNVEFRTHSVRQHFHSTLCQQFDYRIKKRGKYTKKEFMKKPILPEVTEAQSRAIEKIKQRAIREMKKEARKR